MSEAAPPSADEEAPNAPYSPTNSATTGLSLGSSLGIQYKGVWCTPPRVFVDQQVRTLQVHISYIKNFKLSINFTSGNLSISSDCCLFFNS